MNTKTKLFCGCSNDAFGKEPNTLVCPICMGHPGTLPVPNKSAVEKAIKASLALKCTVQNSSHMSRKNYFYPDLPAGYQISQYDFPLALRGKVSFSGTEGVKECGITRLHIENDAGKLTHAGAKSLCDYNRAGTPLMEIVTEPDLRSAEDAVNFAQELRRILIAVNSSEADMYKGMMRFDASISLRPKGEKKLYPRTEIKNLNSFKALEKALNYQMKELTERWEKDDAPKGEVTVGWVDDEEKTVMLRDKESAADYRYFPEPDIPPLVFDQSSIDALEGSSIELPEEIRQRYLALKLTEAEAQLLIDQPSLQHLFDAVQKKTNDARRTSSLVLTQLMGFLKAQNKTISDAPSADAVIELIDAVDKKTITANAAKEVLEAMVSSGKSAKDIITEKGITQMQDTGAIEKLVDEAIAANPEAIESWKNGKGAALGAVVGWVMKESKGKADPVAVNKILMLKLNG